MRRKISIRDLTERYWKDDETDDKLTSLKVEDVPFSHDDLEAGNSDHEDSRVKNAYLAGAEEDEMSHDLGEVSIG